jgi:hypothetical protein
VCRAQATNDPPLKPWDHPGETEEESVQLRNVSPDDVDAYA